MKKIVFLLFLICAGTCGPAVCADAEWAPLSQKPAVALQEPLISGTEDMAAEYKLLKEPVMTLEDALIRGIQNNLDIKVSRGDVVIADQGVRLNASAFDPYVDASAYSAKDETPTTVSSYSLDTVEDRKSGFSLGVTDRMSIGLKSRLAARAVRTTNNSTTSDLDPEYRSALVLELTQPLLKDFGVSVNQADLNVAENQAKQARFLLLTRVSDTVRAIEKTYYELDRALANLQFRIESRELALTLLSGNQKKFDSGVVPISEVQSAETTVASRDEQIVYSIQQAEVISDQLKDLLNIRSEDPLYTTLIVTESINRTHETVPNLDTALATALNKRPELGLQQLDIENKDIKLVFYKNQRLPRVDLVGTLGVNGLSGDTRPTVYGALPSVYEGNFGDSFSSMADADGTSWRVGLNFLYPLGNRGAKALYAIAQESKKQSLYKYKRIEGRFETDVKNAAVNVKRSLERVEVANRFEELAAITLDQEMKRLAEGLSDTFRIVVFQAGLIEAKIRKSQAMADYNKGLSDLYYSMGILLDQHNMTTKFNMEEMAGDEK